MFRTTGHDQRALQVGAAGVLSRRQRQLARRQDVDRADAAGLRNACLIHLPIHASWLNQAELFLSIVQRKALTPNDFASLDALADRLLTFGEHYRQVARPFEWTFKRADLDRVLDPDRRPRATPPTRGLTIRTSGRVY